MKPELGTEKGFLASLLTVEECRDALMALFFFFVVVSFLKDQKGDKKKLRRKMNINKLQSQRANE